MRFRADLHIHSCLSPCGDLSMSPRTIAERAKQEKLDIIALTDHNTARNTAAFAAACNEFGVTGLFGLEATTSEELHILCLFEDPQTAAEFGETVYDSLISYQNNPIKFGDQVYLDNEENILGELEKNLIGGGSAFDLDRITAMAHERGGIAIPAHIGRPAYSLRSQLGYLPPGDFDALESTEPFEKLPQRLRSETLPLTASSDAHRPEDIGRRHTVMQLEEPTFENIRNRLQEFSAETLRGVFG